MIFQMIKPAGAALSLLAIASTAQAADIIRPPYKASPYNAQAQAAMNWTGLYVGGHLGYAMTSDSGLYDQADAAGPTNLAALKLNGLVYGAQIGFNFQFSNFVVGLEADGSFGKRQSTINSPEPAPRGPDPITSERGNLMSVRGRVGYAFNRALVYGTGGVGWADRKLTITEAFDGSTGSIKSNKMGGVYGAGIEYAILNNFSVRLEYLRYQVKTTVTLDPATFADADPGDSITFGNVDVVRLGANYRF